MNKEQKVKIFEQKQMKKITKSKKVNVLKRAFVRICSRRQRPRRRRRHQQHQLLLLMIKRCVWGKTLRNKNDNRRC